MRTLLIFLVVLAIIFSGCVEERKKVVWDVDHKPVFPPSHYSKLISQFEADVIEGGVEELNSSEAYILAGVTRNFSEEEVEKILEFVKNGGKLVILIHIPPANLEPLLDRFGVEVSERPYEIMEVTAVPGEDNVLTKGVKEIYMRGVFPVNGTLFVVKKDRAIIFGGMKGGVAALKKYGKGEVLVFGDDAMFLDSYINKVDNLKLAKNIAKWIN
ncbi:ABC-type uncharacterized transport system [Ferroglobus placidus DSM 10642]|uniref:ABC-type uncharacterized transport system n=1 Tax=Ferroglobus placidus (strain DSM 10642 / AEDII12DO) TaxID=589924 RepID=D3S1C5_FERPA|nr:DUF4350 domain-containing protein [Ferroglobus placidus]ADC66389.1 ABC-type uncharacterized transport system [Ferroglobus placidus DSM 10642]